MRKAPAPTSNWLDSNQYTTESILHYEKVFGEGFVSPGGRKLSSTLIARLDLMPDQHILDVGCGLGGSAFLMAELYKATVVGIDLSENMLELARTKLVRNQLQDRVSLIHKDCLSLIETHQFDAIYSRDVFLHIENKRRLFEVLHRALKTDGKLLFTDYACGPRPWHTTFRDYVASRDYHLHTVGEYAEVVQRAGFHTVVVDDSTELFIDLLVADIHTIEQLEIADEVKQSLNISWQSKLERARGGDHRWVTVSARASSHSADST